MLHEGGGAKQPVKTYYYRRSLSTRELLPVAGIAAGAAAAVFAVTFYFARMFAQRTPLLPESEQAPGRTTTLQGGR